MSRFFKKFISMILLVMLINIDLSFIYSQELDNIAYKENNNISKSSVLVNTITWTPYNVSPQVGTFINFNLNINPNFKIEDLEFQLWAKINDEEWEIVQKYGEWPIKEYYFKEKGIYNLQIDVRAKNSNYIQKIWLGQFFTHKENRLRNSDKFLDNLLENYKPDNMKLKIDKYFIRQLNLSLSMMLWEYNNIPIPEQIKKLSQISGMKILNNGLASRIIICRLYDQLYYIDFRDREIIRVNNGYKGICIELSKHPNIEYIYKKLENHNDLTKIAAAITYLIYQHYEYGQVLNYLEYVPFFSNIGHCGTLSEDVYNVLKELNYDVETLGINYKDGAVHALNKIKIDDRDYILDATIGGIYYGDIKEIKEKKLEPILFPQVRNLDVLWEKERWDQIAEIYIINYLEDN